MKRLLILIGVLSSLSAVNRTDVISTAEVIEKGYSKEITCKNGYVTVIVKNDRFVIEYPLCTMFSSWNNECTHLPVKCDMKEKTK